MTNFSLSPYLAHVLIIFAHVVLETYYRGSLIQVFGVSNSIGNVLIVHLHGRGCLRKVHCIRLDVVRSLAILRGGILCRDSLTVEDI